ncbi:hypothetical protein [Chitinophaga sp. HK235]|uniref:hypothetical protein n=1 Tax=Chitinophaga sp. HK235 TaxID=2952571 RepID=UPI001BAB4988|nr:hypothetical protein [Chitinophaga sp. HK235]
MPWDQELSLLLTGGSEFFELSNHLGNLLATVGDDKRSSSGPRGLIDHYEANVVSAQDYYPFGMQMVFFR